MTCLGSGLRYIGKTKYIKRRPSEHKSECYNEKNKNYNNKRFQYIRSNNIKWENIIFEIIDTVYCNESQARGRESELIKYYNSIENGQNELMPSELSLEEQKKQWCKNNSEYIKEKIQCPICQKNISRNNMARHKRKIHKL